MSDESPHRTDAEPSDVRFGTRALLIAMAVVAAVCTGVGAILRQFPANAQPRLVVYWCVLIALLLACFTIKARLRYTAEKRAGRVRFQLVPHSYSFPNAPRFASILLGSFFLALAPAWWAANSFMVADDSFEWWQMLDLEPIAAIMISAGGMTYLWWHRKLRLGKDGLVVRHKLLPWGDVKCWYWDACNRDVIVLEFKQYNRVAAKVPAELREAVLEFLSDRCGWISDKPPRR